MLEIDGDDSSTTTADVAELQLLIEAAAAVEVDIVWVMIAAVGHFGPLVAVRGRREPPAPTHSASKNTAATGGHNPN